MFLNACISDIADSIYDKGYIKGALKDHTIRFEM
ncbi:MAG: hypothetical protein BWY67_00590 [Bacteroidetes bacterium ADurb.Bin397]|jgi:hypothetical protein|nr:MAG: hypothetical protein BWY67_00590 [Bacteroidetes bacterium ADurb.Bin397]